jgi:hypothetical protein
VVTNKQSVIKGDLIAVIAKAAVDKGVAARYDDEWDILQWIASIGNIQNNGTFWITLAPEWSHFWRFRLLTQAGPPINNCSDLPRANYVSPRHDQQQKHSRYLLWVCGYKFSGLAAGTSVKQIPSWLWTLQVVESIWGKYMFCKGIDIAVSAGSSCVDPQIYLKDQSNLYLRLWCGENIILGNSAPAGMSKLGPDWTGVEPVPTDLGSSRTGPIASVRFDPNVSPGPIGSVHLIL